MMYKSTMTNTESVTFAFLVQKGPISRKYYNTTRSKKPYRAREMPWRIRARAPVCVRVCVCVCGGGGGGGGNSIY